MEDWEYELPELNGIHILSGMDEDGFYTVRAGKKGKNCKVRAIAVPSSEQIKELRTSFGLTQKEFAKAIGVAATTISSWERGHYKPDGVACRFMFLLAKYPELIKRYM